MRICCSGDSDLESARTSKDGPPPPTGSFARGWSMKEPVKMQRPAHLVSPPILEDTVG